MESGFVAVGAAAVAYYVYSHTRRDLPSSSTETHRHVEQAPQNWTGEVFLFAEALRYLYVEYITHWQTADLFIGLFYLARQGIRDFPAAEVVAHGKRTDAKSLETTRILELKDKFEVMYRLLIYSQKLRNTSIEIPTEEWMELSLCREDFVVYHPRASVLRPAYVIVKDPTLQSFVLAIRGTHTTRDIFTSLSGAAKPHHYIDGSELVLGYSHLGMLAGARWIFKHCKEALLAAYAAQPDYKLLITGHSMGGGAAAMLTMMFREQVPQFDDVQCYTFACPGCMTLELAQSCAPYVSTLIYGTDVVPTISPGAGDLLREEVAQSSWSASFTQDIRSLEFVQSIEGRVKTLYRSASTWTMRQARNVSSLTTGCIRPRNKPSAQSMDNLQAPRLDTPLVQDDKGTVAREAPPLNEAESSGSLEVQEGRPSNPSAKKLTTARSSASASKGSTLAELWSRVSHFSWKRRVSDTEPADAGTGASASPEEDVEGVFNAQGMEEDGEGMNGGTSNGGTSNAKRLLYPAGKIYHLVPEYILRAATPDREKTESTASLCDAYSPGDQASETDEESAFVLFSDMPQEAYGKIRVCRSMVMDHFVPRYKTALRSTIQEFNAALEETNTHCI